MGYYINERKEAMTICQAYAMNNREKFVGAWTFLSYITKIRKLK